MVVFVILHYNDYVITEQAVDTIMRNNADSVYHIVIVDNGSPNGSGEILTKKYAEEKSVSVLLTGANLGFAQGNNFGYTYVKKNFNADYIVVMNNDVMIKQANFVSALETNEFVRKYEVIMPDIINKSGYHQNPFRLKPMSDVEMKKNYRRILMFKTLYSIPFINYIWINRNRKLKKNTNKSEQHFSERTMMVPHGACVIYSKLWIDKEKYAFVPDTFLYGEEDILYEYIVNKKYRTYYEDELKVNHLEDVATNSVAQTDLKKAKFLFKHSFDSQKVLKRLRKYNRENKNYII